jgi:hypothetical protein
VTGTRRASTRSRPLFKYYWRVFQIQSGRGFKICFFWGSREWYPRELRIKIRGTSSKCWCAAPAGVVLVCVGSKIFEQCVTHIRNLYSRTMPFVFVISNAALSFIIEQFTFVFCFKSRLVRPIGILLNLQVSFDHSSFLATLLLLLLLILLLLLLLLLLLVIFKK